MYQKPEFFKALCKFAAKVLPLIDPAIKAAYYPKEFDNYPGLTIADNGFPKISKYPSRVDVGKFFYPAYTGAKIAIDPNGYVEYNWMLADLRDTPEFCSYFSSHNQDLKNDRFLKHFLQDFIISFIELYYYRYGIKLSVAKMRQVYLPYENFIFAKEVYFDIAVPILFLHFEIEQLSLSDNIEVRKISDEHQRARYRIQNYSPPTADSVYMSATHELVFKNYHYSRQPTFFNSFHFAQPEIYPVNGFEKFFSVLKLVTDQTSGFAQILVYPHNWAILAHVDTVHVEGAAIKSYPNYFDDFYWNKETFPLITRKQIKEISALIEKIGKLTDNKVDIALKRFYKSVMRQEEEDIIIDLIIAFEILLSDNEKNDITYKLSMRISALICYYHIGKYKPTEVFGNVKKMYDYRSAIVHGNHNRAKKNREIQMPNNTIVPVVEIAREYLRLVLMIVIKEPRHLDPKNNDRLILQGKF